MQCNREFYLENLDLFKFGLFFNYEEALQIVSALAVGFLSRSHQPLRHFKFSNDCKIF